MDGAVIALSCVLAPAAADRVGWTMNRTNEFRIYAWGMWFSMVHGWQREPDLSRTQCHASAAIVKVTQPGATVVGVSA